MQVAVDTVAAEEVLTVLSSDSGVYNRACLRGHTRIRLYLVWQHERMYQPNLLGCRSTEWLFCAACSERTYITSLSARVL